MGKEFYCTFLPAYEYPGVLYLLISCPVQTRVTVDIERAGFHKEIVVKALEPARVDIPVSVAQPYRKTHNDLPPTDANYPAAAIHVSADFPILLYVVNSSLYTGDSYLALPVETLGNDYIAASAPDASVIFPGYKYPGEIAIVAIENGTQITYTVGGTQNVKTAGGLSIGQSKTITLNRGDVYVMSTDTKTLEEDFSGTKITSSKSVAVISGSFATPLPSNVGSSDHLSEMLFPTHTWGKTCLVPRFTHREFSYLLKVFTKEPNTFLSFNGKYFKTMLTAGGAEGTGYLYQRADVSGNNVSVYSADKPLSCMVYNTGPEDNASPNDPFLMGVVPIEQFSKFLFFSSPFTPDIKYTEFIGFVLPLTDNATIPDDLEFGTVTTDGTIQWRKFTTIFGSSIGSKDRFILPKTSVQYVFKECPAPGPGVYALRCSKPVFCYLYGARSSEGYGLPSASMMLDMTKTSDTLKPAVTLSQLDSSASGIFTDLPNNAAVRSNLSKVFLNYGSNNIRFNAASITSPSVSSLPWSLEVIDTQKDALAIITASDRAGNDTTITLRFAHRITIRKPEITLSDSTLLCENDTIVLSSKNTFARYLWSTGDTMRYVRLHLSTPGKHSYWLTGTAADGASFTSDTTVLVVHPLPALPHIQQNMDTLRIESSPGMKYQWYYNRQLLPGATDYTLIISTGGTYSVQVEDSLSGCSIASESFEATYTTSSITDGTVATFSLHPNPTSNTLVINYTDLQVLRVSILSAIGQVVLEQQLQQDDTYTQTLNLHHLPNGIYLLRLQCAGKNLQRHFVIER